MEKILKCSVSNIYGLPYCIYIQCILCHTVIPVIIYCTVLSQKAAEFKPEEKERNVKTDREQRRQEEERKKK